jgi:hypothetical protein
MSNIYCKSTILEIVQTNVNASVWWGFVIGDVVAVTLLWVVGSEV